MDPKIFEIFFEVKNLSGSEKSSFCFSFTKREKLIMPPKRKSPNKKTCIDKEHTKETETKRCDLYKDPKFIDLIVAEDLFMALKKAKHLLPTDTPQFVIKYNSECSVCHRKTILITSTIGMTYCSVCEDGGVPNAYPSVEK